MTENVANNVAQGNSQDLTEKWRYGKLKNGFYYIKDINDRVTTILYRQDHISVIKEVLAPVPRYEEWQELSKQRNQLIRDVKDLAYIKEENQQLRKWCEEFNALEVAEENEALKTKLSIQCEANEELRKENQQLKELLYNSMVYLNCHIDNDGNVFVNGVSTSSFIKEIDNAIGEKK